ncbi:phosphatidylserine synthase [Pelotomaculum thermopropionicum SI]|uniref:CDP-diacylglycerol--serine O-phosphatidyltransferase n=1 Tax=Pelotomaculum thermopropionicum (strain DSM 13744 / JCM 10971 / SI) TaxID=370438 RepID=A5D0R1_PELTS|nr:phosphatidylserine synthase [Pelotomaculum thermopropionicum SI]
MSRIEILPNLCTAANLFFGVMAIAAVINHNFQLSVALVIIAAILDRADGALARRCNAISSFGKEFDSLADLVSFGVAPAALLYSVTNSKWHAAGLACFVLFTLCGAFRLARFNISDNSSCFQGVPITIAGSVMALLVALLPHSVFIILLSSVMLSAAMVCTIRIPKI